LQTALKRSAKPSPLSARILNSRDSCDLRLGDYDKSIADYDDAAEARPKNAWSCTDAASPKCASSERPRPGGYRRSNGDLGAGRDEFKRRGIIPDNVRPSVDRAPRFRGNVRCQPSVVLAPKRMKQGGGIRVAIPYGREPADLHL